MNTARFRTAATTIAALALAGLTVPAAAQTQSNIANSAERTATSSATPDQRRICVRSEMTGTRLTRNVCRTRAEWDRAGGIPQAD